MTNFSFRESLPKDLNAGMSFKDLIKMIKTISKNEAHPLHRMLKEHYLLFHYILHKGGSAYDILQQSNNDINQTFHLNPQKKYNEIRISCIDYQETCLILFEFTNETDRKRYIELNTINEHKNKILAHVAHEFRTPLNSIIGNLELVQDLKEIPSQIKEDYLQPALFSSTLLLNYINDILDFSQMRSEKLKMNYIKFNLLDHITTISKIMEILALKKGVNFEKKIAQNLPAIITSDPNRLTQILLNLLSNAFKFTLPSGTVILKITAKQDQEDQIIKFEISDTGIGISAENMKKLFKEFGKISGDENSMLNPSGVGLGLIISQKFAEEMGPLNKQGFEVKSEIGKGTSFAFYLEDKNCDWKDRSSSKSKQNDYNMSSINLGSDSIDMGDSIDLNDLIVKNKNLEEFQKKKLMIHRTKVETSRLFVSPSKTFDKLSSRGQFVSQNNLLHNLISLKCFPFNACHCPKILVVDDDMFNVSYLQNVLKLLGFATEFAVNGEVAVNIMKSRIEGKCCENCKIFKMIFMDSEMPLMNGLQATALIKTMPYNSKTVIIGCTGNTAPCEINKFKNAGADIVCSKPITKAKILNILETYKNILEE